MQSKSFFIPFNMHPLFYSSIFFILGIYTSSVTTGCYPLFLILSPLLLLFLLFHQLTLKTSALISLLTLSYGAGYIRHKQQISAYNKFHTIYQNAPCTIKGTITDIGTIEHQITKQKVVIKINNIKKNNLSHWEKENRYIQIYTYTNNTIMVGDYIQINDITFKRPRSPSFQSYLIKEKIVATIFNTRINFILVSRPTYSLQKFIFNLRKRLISSLRQKLSPSAFTLFSSLFLGNRSINKKQAEKLSDQFKQWGGSHYLARSGLHLVIFVIIWQSLLRTIPLSYMVKQIILLIFGILFFVLSWPTTSFIRAFYAFIYCKMCFFLTARSHFLHTITLITLIILFTNPMQLFFLDFQLSFSLTFGLAWVAHLKNSTISLLVDVRTENK